MWKCPKCGREFKNVDQGHYCGKAPETVDEYILAQDDRRDRCLVPGYGKPRVILRLMAEDSWCLLSNY